MPRALQQTILESSLPSLAVRNPWTSPAVICTNREHAVSVSP